MNKKWTKLLLALLVGLSLLLTGCDGESPSESGVGPEEETILGEEALAENGSSLEEGLLEEGTYSSKEEVAAYLHRFGQLPSNYITKKQAEALGWQSNRGNLWEVAPGKSIGGDRFGNREGLLPKGDKRQYYECDIDYEGGYRNEKRIVFSEDGLIFYTGDHYKSFEQLYEEEK